MTKLGKFTEISQEIPDFTLFLRRFSGQSDRKTMANKIHYKQCPLCGSRKPEHFLTTEDFLKTHETFELFRCRECGMIFTQDVPVEAEAGDYYRSEDYISHSDTRKGLMNNLYHRVRKFMLHRKLKLVRHLTKGRNLLDIGCGTGYFPAYMKQKGYNASGVEISPEAREFGIRKFDLEIIPPGKFLTGTENGVYDVITLWHVLEHLYDPGKYLDRIYGALKDDGVLIIALPNHRSQDARFYKKYWAGYDVPRHLWHFSPKTLAHLTGLHYFRVTGMHEMPFDPFFNALLSEKYRKDPLWFVAGLLTGFFAFLRGFFRVEKASSVIYVLRKNTG